MPLRTTARSSVQLQTRLAEATTAAIPVRAEDKGWINLGRRMGRDLPQHDHQKMILYSFYLYRTNPLAKRIINLGVDFILGSGLTIASEDAATLAYLQQWWNDPYNAWPTRIHRRLRDLLIYGEWFHLPIVHEPTGMVRLNIIQPDQIKTVIPNLKNHELAETLILREATVDQTVQRDKALKIIRPLFDAKGQHGGYEGDAWLFGINRTTDTTRGVGELFPLIDYIDTYDEMLFNRAEKVAMVASMWWDLKMDGMNERDIAAYLARDTTLPPKPGTVWGHNEKAELKLQTPPTGADDHAEDVRTQKSHIVSSAGFPGTWFDESGSAGRAVAAEMAEPTHKGILSLQIQVAGFIHEEMSYALIKARQAGTIKTIEPFYLSFPSPSVRDIQRVGPAINRLAQAIDAAIKGGYLTKVQGAQIMTSQINQLGLSAIPLKVAEEVENSNTNNNDDGGNGDGTNTTTNTTANTNDNDNPFMVSR